jgi:sugar O-acyltransferase (sialic acid O-acetyltransferase NeuD family)
VSRIVVYGASDHGKYTIDILERAGEHTIVGIIDDGATRGLLVYGYPVLGGGDQLPSLRVEHDFVGGVVAIGDNFVRGSVVRRIEELDPQFEFVTAIHPFTSIGRETVIGKGTVIMAGAIVNGSSIVGEHSFIATKASLDHDSRLGRCGSMSPGATTGGRVSIGSFSTLSAGATVIHGVSVGEHTVVGAGSTVVRDLPDRVVAYGTPCRVVRGRQPGEAYL